MWSNYIIKLFYSYNTQMLKIYYSVSKPSLQKLQEKYSEWQIFLS